MIAIPITSKTVDSALKDIRLAEKSGADVVELRLDYIPTLGDGELMRMMRASKLLKIVTVRRKADGGHFTGTEKERLRVLKKACELGADYVDVELDADIGVFKDAGVKTICSYHDFSETPRVDDLLAVLESCLLKGPDVVKIVTMANKYNDNVKIFEFLEKSKVIAGDVKVISFCMGEKGKLSRALCVKFGSFLTFASLGCGKESALGQIDINLMKEFMEVVVS
ncbi:MAG: type I 3-dehydroquinate dehydratase [archaeon]